SSVGVRSGKVGGASPPAPRITTALRGWFGTSPGSTSSPYTRPSTIGMLSARYWTMAAVTGFWGVLISDHLYMGDMGSGLPSYAALILGTSSGYSAAALGRMYGVNPNGRSPGAGPNSCFAA